MKAQLLKLLDGVRTSLWFVPTVLVMLAALAAFGLVHLDGRIDPEDYGLSEFVFGGGPEGARGVLSSIATSIVTVAGVAFSITIVVLALAAQQFTPRVLRRFMADRANQVTLGALLATFVYCILVLRTVRTDDFGEFIPHMAVTGGVLLALVGLGMLIYFIHHTATSIQPSFIVSQVAAETNGAIDRLFPEPLGRNGAAAPEVDHVPTNGEDGAPIAAVRAGYIQAVDTGALMRLAGEHDAVIRLERLVGDFTAEGELIATVLSAGKPFDRWQECVNGAIAIDRNRTIQQDPEFGVIQIADIAVKALSPGINDPTTALTCIDYLADTLRRMGARAIPSPLRRDEAGKLRIIAAGTNFGVMTHLAFSQIRRYGAGDAAVCIRMLQAIVRIAGAVADPERRSILRDHAAEIHAAAGRELSGEEDRKRVDEWVQRAFEALSDDAASGIALRPAA